MWLAPFHAGERVALPGAAADADAQNRGAKRRGEPWRATKSESGGSSWARSRRTPLRRRGSTGLWVADITYLRLPGRARFSAFVLNAYSRMIVGWELVAPHAHRPGRRKR